MKQLLLFFALSFASLGGYGDTLDYWHVYINDSVVLRFNAVSDDLTLHLNSIQFTEVDEISIRKFGDTHCHDCKFVLFVRDEKKRKLRITQGTKFGGKLSFLLKDLIGFGRKNGSKRYDFFYWRIDAEGERTGMRLVLQLTVD